MLFKLLDVVEPRVQWIAQMQCCSSQMKHIQMWLATSHYTSLSQLD